jgi:uncharacterized coiled-coil protein SlyX
MPKKKISSSEVKKEIEKLEKEIASSEKFIAELNRKIAAYMKTRPVDEFTQHLYDNRVNFNPKSIVIHSESQHKLKQDYETLKAQYIELLREELISNFVEEIPELSGKLKNVEVKTIEQGTFARLELK